MNECKDCQHWYKTEDDESVGQCKRFPRVFCGLKDLPPAEYRVRWFYPLQFDTDICGEFKG